MGAERPTVWIELGGRLEAIGGSSSLFTPPFLAKHPDAPYNAIRPLPSRPAQYGFGGEGKISLRPDGTDWVFSAAANIRASHIRMEATASQHPYSFNEQTDISGPEHGGTNPSILRC